jgi:hypothetical protein
VIIKGGGKECIEAATKFPEVEKLARKTLKMLDGEVIALMVDAAIPKGIKKLAHIDPLGMSSHSVKTRGQNTLTADDKEKRFDLNAEESESSEVWNDSDDHDQGSDDYQSDDSDQ